MTDRRCLMVVHAHPDDEVFSTGGILAKYSQAGDRVVVVYGTRGENGEMHDPDLDAEEAMPRLGEIREREAREACALLGVTDVFFLGYRDSGMRDTEENKDPRAFMNAPLEEAASRLVELIRETKPEVVVSYEPESRYDHPDHVMTSRVTVEAFERSREEGLAPEKLYYSVSSRESFRRYIEGVRKLGLEIPWFTDEAELDAWGMPEAEISTFVDIAPFAPLKKQALAVHRSQIKPDFFFLSVPDEVYTEYSGVEYFLRVYPPLSEGEREDDLFAPVKGRVTVA